jgi:hypothetical protein
VRRPEIEASTSVPPSVSLPKLTRPPRVSNDPALPDTRSPAYAPPRRVMTLITPSVALEPYSEEPAPRMISMRSTRSMSSGNSSPTGADP